MTEYKEDNRLEIVRKNELKFKYDQIENERNFLREFEFMKLGLQ